MGLSAKQRVFVEEYLQCWNASEAARRAGYGGKANVVGPRLLANVSISEEVSRRVADIAMSADEALVRLAEHARGSMADFITTSGRFGTVDLGKAAAAGKLHLVKKYSNGPKTGVEVELYDAQSALVTILKAHGVFKEQHEHKVEIEVDGARDHLAQLLARAATGARASRDSGEPDG